MRDEYFARISWPAKGTRISHVMPVDAFLRAIMRDVAWGFFYGWVNFDAVVGTRNLYGKRGTLRRALLRADEVRGAGLHRDLRLAGDHGDLQGDPRSTG